MPLDVFTRTTVTADNVSWTAITAPFPCNCVTLLNLHSANMKLRTDSADADTEITLPPNAQEEAGTTISGPHVRTFRFQTGSTVVYAQTASGTGDIKATWII